MKPEELFVPDTIVFVFIDGIGIGQKDPSVNPFARFASTFFSVLGGEENFSPPGILIETDAHLGVEGLPQSGTGQTALFTGYNGAKIMGRHVAGFPPHTLRPYLKERSIIKKLVDAGLEATLANAYTPRYFEWISKARGERFMSASTLMQLGSGKRLLDLNDLRAGESLYMDITHHVLRERGIDIPLITPKEAGRRLLNIARKHRLVTYEYFLTDTTGHEGSMAEAKTIISHLDGLLQALWDELDPTRELVIISSDHGNFEDLSRGSHTENRVATILYGAGMNQIAPKIKSLYDIPRQILALHDIEFQKETAW